MTIEGDAASPGSLQARSSLWRCSISRRRSPCASSRSPCLPADRAFRPRRFERTARDRGASSCRRLQCIRPSALGQVSSPRSSATVNRSARTPGVRVRSSRVGCSLRRLLSWYLRAHGDGVRAVPRLKPTKASLTSSDRSARAATNCPKVPVGTPRRARSCQTSLCFVPRPFDELVGEAEHAEIAGWDFGWLEGRAYEERPSWHYFDLVASRTRSVSAMLDTWRSAADR